MKKRVIVTGGAGFVGATLLPLLAEQYKVEVVDTLITGARERLPEGALLHTVDVRDMQQLIPLFKEAFAVVHLAALPKVEETIADPLYTHSVNVDGTLSVFEAARGAGVGRVVFASSAAVYGENEAVPLAESAQLTPKSPYGLHKQIGEEYATLYSSLFGMHITSLRFFNIYGPHFDPTGPYASVIGKFITTRAAGAPLPIVGDGAQTRDFVHVEDVARACLSALISDGGAGEVYNIGSGEETSVNTLAEIFAGDTVSLPARIEPSRSVADITRAKEELHWEPRIRLQEGITKLLQEYDT